jgi:hypothetical protein
VPLVAGHESPFEYLCHAFFEDRRGDGPRNALVWAARGSGKTQLGAIATLLDLLFKPGIEVCILGGSFAQSSRMHHHLRRLLHDEAFCDLLDGRITERHVHLRNGSRVHTLSQSQTAVRGLRAHRLRCDEVDLFDPDVWEAAQLITRSGRCGGIEVHAGVEALSTMHRPFGLMSRLVGEIEAGNTRLFRWSAIDVLEHCPPSRACDNCLLLHEGCGGAAKRIDCRGFLRIDDAIDQRLRVSSAAWQAEMLCQRPDASDRVYPEFDEALHVFGDAREQRERAHAPRPMTWLGGLDFGFRAPSVLLLATLDGANVLRVMDEIVERGMTTQRMIDLAQARCAAWGIGGIGGGGRDSVKTGTGHERGVEARESRGAADAGPEPAARLLWIGADPAGLARNDQSGVSNIGLWRRAGFAVRARFSTIESGVELLRARLASPIVAASSSCSASGAPAPGLLVHCRCANLVRALREYHFDPQRPNMESPVKDGPDHAADALRYIVSNLDGARGSRAECRTY